MGKRSGRLTALKLTVGVTALLIGVAPAAAQEADHPAPQAAPSDSADIVVTARRRDERVQDVPIAAQAFSGEAMRNYGLSTASDLARIVPSLGFAGSFETIPKVTIRGVGTNEFTANVNPAVGLYVDDVYQGLGTGQNFQLYDVQRVEVLRGPQGTLFGKNTTGGAIQYFTEDPSDAFEGRVKLGYGSFNRIDSEAMINLPLGESAALRISGTTQNRGGYWKNRALGTRDGDIERWGIRAKLKFEPTDALEIGLKVAHGKAKDDLRRSRQVGRLPSGADLTGYVADTEYWEGESDLRTRDIVETTNFSGRIALDLGGAKLVSITGYDIADRDALEDPDESPRNLLQTFYPSRGKSFSQEVRLAGETGGLTYVVGGYYGSERQNNGVNLRLFDCFADASCSVPGNAADLRAISAAFGIPTDGLTDADVETIFPGLLNDALAASATVYDFNYRQRSRTLSAFAETTYAVTDRFNVTGGLRYTWEKRKFFGASQATGGQILGPGFGFNGIPAADDAKAWDDVSGRVILDYKAARDILLYASASRGFRAGNYNGAAYSDISLVLPPVNPETVWSYEMGLKSQLFDRRLTFNAAVFYLDFRNKQEFVLLNSQTVLRNAASARTYGFEADLAWQLTDKWLLTGGVAVTDAKYRRFVSDLGDFSGNRLPSAPKFAASGSLTYTTPVPLGADATGFAAIDVQHRSRTFYQSNNDPVASDGGYTAADIRMGLNLADGRIVLNGFVNNLFNTKSIVDSNDLGAPLFLTILTENMPRTWGLSAAYRF